MKLIARHLFIAACLSLALVPFARAENSVSWNAITLKPPVIKAEPLARPMIAVVIDDMGLNRKMSERAVRNLQAPVTMSYLAYAPRVQGQVRSAKAAGHEVMLHLPWEPNNKKKNNPGPYPLAVSMTQEQIRKNLLENLNGFKGYDGVNNHMGSRFSRYRSGLDIVMKELKDRGVFFLDSKTTPDSIAEKTAQEYGVPATHRDVFLDHDEESGPVSTSLREVEDIARRRGSAVAIGHPKDVTLAALESWLPTLDAKGFQLVSMATMIQHRQAAHVAHAGLSQPRQ